MKSTDSTASSTDTPLPRRTPGASNPPALSPRPAPPAQQLHEVPTPREMGVKVDAYSGPWGQPSAWAAFGSAL